jgi:hypothetical protein
VGLIVVGSIKDQRRPSMSVMVRLLTWTPIVVVVCLVAARPVTAQNDAKQPDDPKRPRLSLRAEPNVGVAPTRVTLTAELIGGANDYEDLYCVTAEWDWGDGTKSESRNDCDPYLAGKSEIRRRFTTQHVFRVGDYRVTFRLKQRAKVVAIATAAIRVQPGLGDFGSEPDRRGPRSRNPLDPSLRPARLETLATRCGSGFSPLTVMALTADRRTRSIPPR